MLSDFSATPKGQSLQDISLEGNSRNWCSLKLKWLASKITDGSHVSPDTENAVIPFVSTRDVRNGRIDFENCLSTTEESFQSMFRSGCSPMVGDILYSKDGTIGRTAIVLDARRFAVASSLIIIRPNEKRTSSKFLNYALSAPSTTSIVDSYVKGAGLPRLSIQNIQKVSVYVPSLTIQGKISTFLDRETNKIDQIIQKQERLIELLVEKRQAVISHAVTKGLDPTVPMKDSGVEWVGKIPAHWQVKPLKRITTSRCDGPFGSGLKSEHYSDEGVRVVRLQNIRANSFNDSDQAYISVNYSRELEGHDVKEGDVLIAGLGDDRNLVGRSCIAPRGIEPAIVKADCFRFRLNILEAVPAFVAMQLSQSAPSDSGTLSSGSTRSRIPLSVMGLRSISLPPLDEQKEIMYSLQIQLEHFGMLVTKSLRSIELLKERRSALISAAVTGKIDVREVA